MSALLDDLVTANHILFRQGVLDAYGHVSARDPQNPRRFFLSRHMAPALVSAEDILTFDIEGNLLAGGPAKPYTELSIHAAAHFDTRAVAGDTDLMIRTMELGRALLAALGEKVEYLSPGEARLLNAHMQADPSYRRAWEFWAQQR